MTCGVAMTQGGQGTVTRPGPGETRRRLVLAGASIALGAGAGVARAQAGAVRLLVGYPVGGAVDVAARAFADQLRAAIGGTVLVENKPGAAGTLPVPALLQAPPDGTTLMFAPPDPVAILPHSMASLRYTLADLAPVAQLCTFGFALGVGPATPARTLAEFFAWCRANPQKGTYGTPGIGSTMHHLGEALARQARVPLVHVPYRGGAQAITDVAAGQIAALISTAPIIVPQHRAGKIRALAVTNGARTRQLPDVPTFAEAGLPGMTETSFFGLYARAGTPAALLEKYASAAKRAVVAPAFVEAMARFGFDPDFMPPARFAPLVRARSATWARRIAESGIKS